LSGSTIDTSSIPLPSLNLPQFLDRKPPKGSFPAPPSSCPFPFLTQLRISAGFALRRNDSFFSHCCAFPPPFEECNGLSPNESAHRLVERFQVGFFLSPVSNEYRKASLVFRVAFFGLPDTPLILLSSLRHYPSRKRVGSDGRSPSDSPFRNRFRPSAHQASLQISLPNDISFVPPLQLPRLGTLQSKSSFPPSHPQSLHG